MRRYRPALERFGRRSGCAAARSAGGCAGVPERRHRFGKLMRAALNRAAMLGHGAVILVGDAPYYERFGFSTVPTQRLLMPGAGRSQSLSRARAAGWRACRRCRHGRADGRMGRPADAGAGLRAGRGRRSASPLDTTRAATCIAASPLGCSPLQRSQEDEDSSAVLSCVFSGHAEGYRSRSVVFADARSTAAWRTGPSMVASMAPW